MSETSERKFKIDFPPTKLHYPEEHVTKEDIEYLQVILSAYASAALQDGMLKHYLSQASQSDTAVERRIGTEGYDFRDKLGLPRK